MVVPLIMAFPYFGSLGEGGGGVPIENYCNGLQRFERQLFHQVCVLCLRVSHCSIL